MIEKIYVPISIIFGWKFGTRVQRNYIIFASLGDYLYFKFMFALATGWLVTPFYIISFLFRRKTKNNIDTLI